jgi:hypothetical protein
MAFYQTVVSASQKIVLSIVNGVKFSIHVKLFESNVTLGFVSHLNYSFLYETHVIWKWVLLSSSHRHTRNFYSIGALDGNILKP